MVVSQSSAEYRWMRESVEIARRSVSEADVPKPKVGVVIVSAAGELLGQSFRGETGAGRHAEFGLVEQFEPGALEGATVYTTLEPCSRRQLPKIPCAQHLIDAKVAAVYIGIYDPNPYIYREGWRMLRDAGITLGDYPADLRQAIHLDNAEFVDLYRRAQGLRGKASFDYHQNGGAFTLEYNQISIETKWSDRGDDSVYAIDHESNVALARYARSFEEIDDPGALDWSNYTMPVEVGEIVAFRSPDSYALVEIKDVTRGDGSSTYHSLLSIAYELRPANTDGYPGAVDQPPAE